jgi:hypothetical protein
LTRATRLLSRQRAPTVPHVIISPAVSRDTGRYTSSRTSDAGAARGASVAGGAGGNFATHFATLSKASTTYLLAFA